MKWHAYTNMFQLKLEMHSKTYSIDTHFIQQIAR
jgi:hypothetical protein